MATPPSPENPNDLLSQKGRVLRAYSTAARPRCSGFAPDFLVQLTMRVGIPVAHSPQNKPGISVTAKMRRFSVLPMPSRFSSGRHQGNLKPDGGPAFERLAQGDTQA